jgi:NitT/TauT family transport system ATP-binding protein
VFDDGTVALDHVELEVEEGEFVAIVGPSGCGKSTLLRLLARLETPTRGELRVDLGGGYGGSTSRASLRARDRAGSAAPHDDADGALSLHDVAFVFQDAHLLPWRTVVENVALPLELAGVRRAEAHRLAEGPLADVELLDARGRYPDELSGGMRMRVSIARALVTRPRLLLLDEPFAALDELTRGRLDERLRDLWLKHRMTVVFVTHALAEAVFLAERALVMSPRPGRVVLDHRIDLPALRAASLRTDLVFARQTALLYQSLEAYGSLDESRA